ncbi:MAG: PadR family transcriptional regulator [Gemmatimonadetes bacterium]|nr:PadR family transcriptional regulator [Gemmatimonadota bacterium]
MAHGQERAEANLTYNGALVLQAMVQGHPYGFEIMRAARLPSGTVYPLLRRLEAAGLVASRWENPGKAQGEGRPPRRYYEPTPAGHAALAEARERVLAQQALFEGATPKAAGGEG